MAFSRYRRAGHTELAMPSGSRPSIGSFTPGFHHDLYYDEVTELLWGSAYILEGELAVKWRPRACLNSCRCLQRIVRSNTDREGFVPVRVLRSRAHETLHLKINTAPRPACREIEVRGINHRRWWYLPPPYAKCNPWDERLRVSRRGKNVAFCRAVPQREAQ